MKKLKNLVVVIHCILSSTWSIAQNVSININALNLNQTMEGFGTSLRVFNDPHVIGGTTSEPITGGLVISAAEEDTILNLLYNKLGLTRVRPATGEDGPIENPNDNNNPYKMDNSKFDFSWKKMDAHIDFVSRVIPRGVNTYFPSTVKLESWMTTSNPEEYAEWAFAIIKRWKDLGYELPYYAIMNEPGYGRGGIWPGIYLRDCIKFLGPRLDTAGINTKIVIPDDLNANEAYTRSQLIMEDSVARKYVGALAYHLYGGSNANKTAMMKLGQLYNVPVWMTEYSRPDAFDWGNLIHDVIANYNVTAVDHMWGFFGNQESNGTQYISLNFSGTNYTGYTINKQYFVTGQYSRYVKPGAQRIDATSSNNDVRVTAYKDGTDFTLVAINNHSTPQSVDFTINGMSNLSTLNAIRTSQTENWAILPDITLANESFTAILAPNSITSFTTIHPSLGIDDFRSENALPLILYPNPAKEFINVQIPDEARSGSIVIFNNLSQIRKRVELTGTDIQQLNISSLPEGLHWVRLTVDNKTWRARLLIPK